MLAGEELLLPGGSDAAAIAGVHPNKSPLDVYRRVVLGEDSADSAILRRGRLMEPVIREMAREDYGLRLLGPEKLRLRLGRIDARANLDDRHQGGEGEEVVEFKSVSPFAADGYGEPGTDAVPTAHLCQVQWYLAAKRAPRARLYALIGLDDLREYRIAADLEVQSMLLESVERFWVDHVLPKRPPPIDGSTSCAEWLSERYPEAKGELFQATPEVESWVKEYRAATAQAEAAQERRDLAKNRLKEFIGEARGVVGAGWKINWSNVKGRETTDWAAVAAEAGVSAELIRKHTSRKAGYRAFKASFQGAENE